jgi:hypothetical protein
LGGTIPIAFFNVPGSAHDSQVAEYGNIYEKLEDVFCLTGAKCCVDLAFGNMNREYLYKLSQDLFWFFGTDTSREEIGATEKKAGNISATDS